MGSQRKAIGSGTSRSNRRRWCDTANKKRHPDHQSAVRALSSIRKHADRDQLPTRCYECEFCHGWHLTSWEE